MIRAADSAQDSQREKYRRIRPRDRHPRLTSKQQIWIHPRQPHRAAARCLSLVCFSQNLSMPYRYKLQDSVSITTRTAQDLLCVNRAGPSYFDLVVKYKNEASLPPLTAISPIVVAKSENSRQIKTRKPQQVFTVKSIICWTSLSRLSALALFRRRKGLTDLPSHCFAAATLKDGTHICVN